MFQVLHLTLTKQLQITEQLESHYQEVSLIIKKYIICLNLNYFREIEIQKKYICAYLSYIFVFETVCLSMLAGKKGMLYRKLLVITK